MYLSLHGHHQNDTCIKMGSDETHFNVSVIHDLRKSRGLHSVSAYRHGLYIYIYIYIYIGPGLRV